VGTDAALREARIAPIAKSSCDKVPCLFNGVEVDAETSGDRSFDVFSNAFAFPQILFTIIRTISNEVGSCKADSDGTTPGRIVCLE
jgi:hypothetical protein